MVGLAGLEPATFRPPDGRATRLRHSPTAGPIGASSGRAQGGSPARMGPFRRRPLPSPPRSRPRARAAAGRCGEAGAGRRAARPRRAPHEADGALRATAGRPGRPSAAPRRGRASRRRRRARGRPPPAPPRGSPRARARPRPMAGFRRRAALRRPARPAGSAAGSAGSVPSPSSPGGGPSSGAEGSWLPSPSPEPWSSSSGPSASPTSVRRPRSLTGGGVSPPVRITRRVRRATSSPAKAGARSITPSGPSSAMRCATPRMVWP